MLSLKPRPFIQQLSAFFSRYVSLFLLFFGDIAFPEYLCTIAVFSLYGDYAIRFFSPSGWRFFYLVTTGWIFDISLCENSINRRRKKYLCDVRYRIIYILLPVFCIGSNTFARIQRVHSSRNIRSTGNCREYRARNFRGYSCRSECAEWFGIPGAVIAREAFSSRGQLELELTVRVLTPHLVYLV